MKNKLKLSIYIYIYISIIVIQNSYSQTTPSLYFNNYNNLIDVNKTNFDATLTGYTNPPATSDEIKHYVTVCNISKKIYDNYFNPTANAYTYNGAVTITNGLKIVKTKYCVKHLDTINTDPNLRMLIIRPNDTITRPCIMLTNGASDQLNCRDYIFWKIAADFALRGYVVVYYENVGSISFVQKLIGSSGYPLYPLLVNGPFLGIPQITQDQKTKKDFYFVFQNAVAAYNFITQPANSYKINFSSISGYGISLGSWATFSLAYSRQGVNYTNSDYYNFGNFDIRQAYNLQLATTNHFTRLCIPTRKVFNINMRSITLGAFGIGSDMGNFFPTTGGKRVPTLIYYGKNDNIVNIFTGYGIGATTVKTNLSNLLIQNRLVINCNGEHSTLTKPTGTINHGVCNSDIDVFAATTTDEKAFRTIYYLNQIGDYNKATSQFIQNATLPYNHIDNAFILPQAVYNSSGTANGHFINNSGGSCITGITATNPYRLTNSTVEIDEKNIVEKFKIYPNPSSNELYIEFKNALSNYNVLLFNIIGEAVYTQNNIAKEESKLKINTSQLTNGIYRLIIENNGAKSNYSIIINH